MKTRYSFLYGAACLAMLSFFSTGRSLYAALDPKQLQKEVKKIVNLYCLLNKACS